MLTFNQVAAQSLVFFFAGFETSSSTISFCMFELAKCQRIQRKVQAEIDAVSERYNGQITYESLAEMTYLEACIDGNKGGKSMTLGKKSSRSNLKSSKFRSSEIPQI